jgi:hypothetical protein
MVPSSKCHSTHSPKLTSSNSVMSFVGYKYPHIKLQDNEDRSETPHVSEGVEDESTPPASALDEKSHDSIPTSD